VKTVVDYFISIFLKKQKRAFLLFLVSSAPPQNQNENMEAHKQINMVVAVCIIVLCRNSITNHAADPTQTVLKAISVC
jgi:hypothetical protein